MVSYLTEIVGSVIDDDLDFYRLEYSRAGVNQWTTFAEGTTQVVAGVLGVFDPTLLLNDDYEIRVSAGDVSGNIALLTFPLALTANAKIGHFRLDFTDLAIPLAGIPIEIMRSYDSRQALDSGDFGYGWELGYREARIRSSNTAVFLNPKPS